MEPAVQPTKFALVELKPTNELSPFIPVPNDKNPVLEIDIIPTVVAEFAATVPFRTNADVVC